MSHWLLFGYWSLVIGAYLELGIWLLEFNLMRSYYNGI
jgi:hypothetical protein